MSAYFVLQTIRMKSVAHGNLVYSVLMFKTLTTLPGTVQFGNFG